jgi:MurNAc alpha-1-phosphate uridylyltransferase
MILRDAFCAAAHSNQCLRQLRIQELLALVFVESMAYLTAKNRHNQHPMSISALILAAGRGQRMRPLTDSTPKPLLQVRGRALIDWQVRALADGGFTHLVINTDWLAQQIPAHFEYQIGLQPNPYGRDRLSISYSHEGVDFGAALETAGGVARALPLLGEVFWVLAGDVFTPGFTFTQRAVDRFTASDKLAHLWLVPNPAHNAKGDFGLSADGQALNLPADSQQDRFTFSTVALYKKAFFDALPFANPKGIKAPLAPLLRAAMDNQQVTAELYTGPWTDVGTPERLAELNRP